MGKNKYEVGEFVVYHKPKSSPSPGSRARDIHPSPHGEEYNYIVDKYWIVSDIKDENTLEISTRTGKTHHISADDPLLRKANFKERVFLKDKFPYRDELSG
ncbi:MAG: hypothetical protein ACOC6C_04665 [Verrucomicrobiota bacterium]